MSIASMREQGLISVEYEPGGATARFVFEPDTPYNMGEILAYVDDMSEGRSRAVEVYEGDKLMFKMKRVGSAADVSWVNDIAGTLANGI